MPEPTAPLSEEAAKDEAERLIRAAYQPTRVVVNDPTIPTYKDGPRVGDAVPVAQPGRPPMSQGATDASVLMLAGATATTMVGGTAAVLMYVSQFADPLVCGLVFGAPTALLLALARLVNRAKPAPDVHHHYTGPVHHDTRINQTRAVWSKTINRH